MGGKFLIQACLWVNGKRLAEIKANLKGMHFCDFMINFLRVKYIVTELRLRLDLITSDNLVKIV